MWVVPQADDASGIGVSIELLVLGEVEFNWRAPVVLTSGNIIGGDL